MEKETEEKQLTSPNEEKTRLKIRTLMLDGLEYKQIQQELNISPSTWDNSYYLNVRGFRDFVDSVKKSRFLLLAEQVSKEIMAIDSRENAKMASIKQKEAEFLRETLGKDQGYSKRIETIGLNINKNEPLDPEQKKKLDDLIKASGGKSIKEVEVVDVPQDNGSTKP